MSTKHASLAQWNARSLFTIQRKSAFLGALISGFLTHLTLMIWQPVCADPVLSMDIVHYGNWEKLTQGRWAINFFPMLRGYFSSPVVSTLILIVSVSLGAACIVDLFGIKGTKASLLTGISMAVHPHIANTMMYYSLSGTLELFLSIFSVCFIFCYFKKMRLALKIPIDVVIVTLVLGCRQINISTLTFLSLSALIVNLLRDGSNRKALLRSFLCMVLVCLISGSLYILIWKSGVVKNNIQVFYGGAEGYSLRNTILNFPEIIKNIYKTFYSYFWGDGLLHNSYWHRQWLNGIILSASAILFVKEMYRKYASKILGKADAALILISFALVPIAAQSISLIVTGYQFYMVMACAFIFIIPFLLAIMDMSESVTAFALLSKTAVLVSVAVICWTFAISNNAGYSLLNHTSIQTKSLASRVLCRLEEQPEFNYDMQVYFIGQPSAESLLQDELLYQASPGSTFNQQGVWSGTEENTYGWGLYLYRYCGVKLNTTHEGVSNRIEQLAQTNEFKERGSFPAQDSVGMIDGSMVVKLGEWSNE